MQTFLSYHSRYGIIISVSAPNQYQLKPLQQDLQLFYDYCALLCEAINLQMFRCESI